MNKRTMMIISLFILSIFLTGCMDIPPQQPSSQQIEQKQNENNQQTLITNQPAHTLTKSLERENLNRRLDLMNDADKVFYIYLVSYGKVMAFYTAKGKVSSVSSYLTSFDQIVRDDRCISDYHTGANGAKTDCYFVTEAPDLDGSYGTNGEGIFFFTTEGAYVEWKGEYMVSDFPLKLSTPPELVKEVK
jgi:hypothetical protein